MTRLGTIITIGLCPCWDVTCCGTALEWGAHQTIEWQRAEPAGKALNVARALGWMRTTSTAAGLWGRSDYPAMAQAVSTWDHPLRLRLTSVPGQTRLNVTLIDRDRNREMHLRAPSTLTSTKALRALRRDLNRLVPRDSICVFAGSMPPDPFLDETINLVKTCRDRGARLVVDTSGPALRALVNLGGLWLLKPNVEELRYLLGNNIPDTPHSLTAAARRLTDRASIILVSRGAKGALAVTADHAWQGRATRRRTVRHTVGCGDYLLAGFLKGWRLTARLRSSLRTALQAATARAWSLHATETFSRISREVTVRLTPVPMNITLKKPSRRASRRNQCS